MNELIEQAMIRFDLHPVLVDIGASGGTPGIWKNIAARSSYVGFDPDHREIDRDTHAAHFASNQIIHEVITPDATAADAHFFLTHSPYCSSTLRPNTLV